MKKKYKNNRDLIKKEKGVSQRKTRVLTMEWGFHTGIEV